MTALKERLLPLVCVVASTAIILWLWIQLEDFLHLTAESQCKSQIAVGLINYECRRYWDQCAMYYNDCNNGEWYEWERVGKDAWVARRVP